MITEKRWRHAQKSEKNYWKRIQLIRTENIQKDIEAYWRWYLELLGEYIKIADNTKILEVGCGPDGIINYVGKGEKYGIDPLMDCFNHNFEMPSEIKWLTAAGEHIPFQDDYFDLIIATNVLDHAYDPNLFLMETKRVLKSGGILFLTVDCYQPPLIRYRKLKEFLKIGDGPHPHSFSVDSVKNIFKRNNLNILFTGAGKGNLGKYSEGERPGLLKRAALIIKSQGIVAFLWAVLDKILKIIEKILWRGEAKRDIIFIIRK